MNEEPPEENPTPAPLPLVVGRIVIVSGIGVASALGLFLLVAGIWEVGAPVLATTLVFIFLMFYIERVADRKGNTEP